jgi:hypothetical protein
MPAYSYAQQLRVANVTDAIAQYQIEMSVTDRGEVPDEGFFVMRIVNVDDPKQDELERVAGVGDLYEWSLDRPTALLSGQDFYRTSAVTKFYPDIEDAVTAKDFLAEQANKLVDDYILYDTQFRASPTPETFQFPTADVGVLTPLIEDYVAKTAEVDAQQVLVTAKTAECALLDTDYQVALQVRDDQQAALDALLRTQTSINAAHSAMTAFDLAGTNLSTDVVAALVAWEANRAAMSPPTEVGLMDDNLLDDTPGPAGTLWSEYYNGFTPAVLAFNTALQVAAADVTEIGVQVGMQTANRDAAQATVDASLTAKETCAQEETTMTSVLDTLQQEQTQLLADIIALCPAYTPP